MPTSSRFSLRSAAVRAVPAALLLALAGTACSADTSEDEKTESADDALSITAGNLTLAPGESVALQTTVSTQSSARLYTLKYKSSNSQVASVTGAGVVTGVSTGTAKITVVATLLDTGGSASAVANVTVDGTGGVIADAGAPGVDSGAPSAGLPPSGEKPFLGLSFQGLTLDGSRKYPGGGWTDIVGTDSVYGNSSPRYPASLWGGKAAAIDSLQMIWNNASDQTRRIVTDTSVPAGVSNRVLESTFVNPYVNPTQDNFQFFPDTSAPQGMIYFSKWMWLAPDLPSRGPFWFEFHETKTNGASTGGGSNPERFAVALNLASWTQNQIVWSVTHDGWVNGKYKNYAQSILSTSGSLVPGQTTAAPVPLGQWFRVESAWNRSMNGTGWIWMALTVPSSSDPNLRKGVQVFARSGAFNFKWNGVTETVGWNKASNDPIDKVFPFGAYSDLVRSPANPYTIRQTNIETWTTWPSTASPHPAEFK